MAHLENRLKWCLRKGQEGGAKHRGLRKIEPNVKLAEGHITKATHNLEAAVYLAKGNFTDWSVSASFYAMYHALLALLVRFGYESRNQECTFVAVETLILEGKINLDRSWLGKISSFGPEETAVALREEFQYGTSTSLDSSKVESIIGDAREFIELVRETLED